MPHTINGIGTHYYGKKNLQTRTGVCQSCHREGNLASYDTRLWFVFVFIPLIPLSRKRIIDMCPSCSRHYAMDLAKWEAQKQLNVSGAAEKFRDQPTAENAIALHEELLAYQQLDRAAELRKIIQEKFPDHAKAQEYLGLVLSGLGQEAESRLHLQRAFQLRPDLPNARVGMAMIRMKEGQLDDARQLLDFLQKPGAAQLYNLEPLGDLADAYQRAGRHRDALDLYSALMKELPGVAEHAGFRKQVEISEKALSERQSMLPKKKFKLFGTKGEPSSGRRKLATVGVVLLLIAIAFAVSNEWIRRHRQLHVVNGFATSLKVTVDGVGSIDVPAGAVRHLTLAEGDYRAVVTGAVNEEIPVRVDRDYWSRCFTSPVWIVNPGGAGVLERLVVVYSKSGEPGSASYSYGQRFVTYGDIDYPFETPPAKLSMKSSERRKVKTSVMLYDGPSEDLFHHFHQNKQESDAMKYAEARLLMRPDDSDLLEAYTRHLNSRDAIPRLEEMLKKGLSFRPVAMSWHRLYQSVIRNPEREQRLIGEYDAMLAKEPNNSALLYLRGRLSPTREETRSYFERSRKADPKNPYPVYALGYDLMMAGDFAGARPLLEQAHALAPKEELFARMWKMVRLGLGESAVVEKELRQRVSRDPNNWDVFTELVLLLAASQRANDALTEIDRFEKKHAAAKNAAFMREALQNLRQAVRYAAGDLDGMEKALKSRKTPDNSTLFPFQVALEKGRVEEALKIPIAENFLQGGGVNHLVVSLAWDLAGRPQEAAAARGEACKRLSQGDADERMAADLLQSATAPTRAQVAAVVMGLPEKAAFCAALARKFPAQREEFSGLAKQFNLDPNFPRHLVHRAVVQ